MNIYPANEQRISEVERGCCCNAVLPLPPGQSLRAGDPIVFAFALCRAGQEPRYVSGGDSVRVLLTDVTDLRTTDPASGRALFQLSWEPPGQDGSAVTTAQRGMRRR